MDIWEVSHWCVQKFRVPHRQPPRDGVIPDEDIIGEVKYVQIVWINDGNNKHHSGTEHNPGSALVVPRKGHEC